MIPRELLGLLLLHLLLCSPVLSLLPVPSIPSRHPSACSFALFSSPVSPSSPSPSAASVLVSSPPPSASDLSRLSPQSLASLGDALFNLWARQHLMYPLTSPSKHHDRVANAVTASSQARLLSHLVGSPLLALTAAEEALILRSRNAAAGKPRTADPKAYADATSLEALLGFLYVQQDWDRLLEVKGVLLESLGEDGREPT